MFNVNSYFLVKFDILLSKFSISVPEKSGVRISWLSGPLELPKVPGRQERSPKVQIQTQRFPRNHPTRHQGSLVACTLLILGTVYLWGWGDCNYWSADSQFNQLIDRFICQMGFRKLFLVVRLLLMMIPIPPIQRKTLVLVWSLYWLQGQIKQSAVK